MPRGVYRHFEGRAGADIWRARVELDRGQWRDVEHAEYDRSGYQPPFWDLPLEEDHLENVLHDPFIERDRQFVSQVEHPAVVIGVIIVSALFAIVVGALALFAL